MSDISWLAKRPVAHRGFHDLNDKVWENTLSAFHGAVEREYAIECDVRLSSDGVPVIFHDGGLERLTDTEGLIWQRTAAELTALKVGRTEDHVPTLKDLLDLVQGRVPLVVELKGSPGHDDGLVERVCDMLRHYDGEAAIMSFDHWLIRQFRAHAKNIPTGLTACGSLTHELEMHFSMLGHGICFVSYGVFDLPNRFVSFVRDRLGMPVISWTVRGQEDVERTFAHVDQMTFEGFDPDQVLSS